MATMAMGNEQDAERHRQRTSVRHGDDQSACPFIHDPWVMIQ
jgi:hypothetical protein